MDQPVPYAEQYEWKPKPEEKPKPDAVGQLTRQEAGRKGGLSRSVRKHKAAVGNGLKGGRPRKQSAQSSGERANAAGVDRAGDS